MNKELPPNYRYSKCCANCNHSHWNPSKQDPLNHTCNIFYNINKKFIDVFALSVCDLWELDKENPKGIAYDKD